MIKFDFDNWCSGCGICAEICQAEAIKLQADRQGFKMPVINVDKCVNCGKCDQVCVHLNSGQCSEKDKSSWLYQSEDSSAKNRSSSGAAFFELGRAMLADGGYVCGCVWDDNLEAKHIVSNDLEDLIRMQGSKYVQSDVAGTYSLISDLLKNGKKVLFSGVPCQCVAISNYVKCILGEKYRTNLLTIGMICHGVPSPAAWNSYKEWLNTKHQDTLVKVNFRDKSKDGYRTSYCCYEFQSGKVIYQPTFLPTSKYIEATLVYNLAIRKSCSHCNVKGMNAGVDILLGDWYAEYKGKGQLGTSCIVAVTEHGEQYVIAKLRNLREFAYADILKQNSYIEKSVALTSSRELFLDVINDYRCWDKVEKLYPKKYPIKKVLVKTGLYSVLKGKI